MHKFAVTVTEEIEAEAAEEAALLIYQEPANGPAPLRYSVTDETRIVTKLTLDPGESR